MSVRQEAGYSRMVSVKICGLTRKADVVAAMEAGAAYAGVIFAGGPRQLTLDAAVELFDGVHGICRVGVFADQSASEIAQYQSALSLDVVQLHKSSHASLAAQLASELPVQVWPVVHIGNSGIPDSALELAQAAGWLLLDTGAVGQLGGTGRSFDWAQAASGIHGLREAVPGLKVVVAGGMRPSNAFEAVHTLKPDVVDVSSGVENAPGIKDHDAIRAFVQAVHSANTVREHDAG